MQRSHTPVIRLTSPYGLDTVPDRGTNKEPAGRDAPGEVRRDVVRAQMHSRGTSRDGDIEPIVEEDRHGEFRDESSRDGQEIAVAGLLEAKLHGGDPPRDRALAEGDYVAPAMIRRSSVTRSKRRVAS